MRGVDNHKIWGSHYIVLMNWTEYNVKEKKHEYLGVDLRLIPYDYSGCLFFLPCPKSTTHPGISYKISEKP